MSDTPFADMGKALDEAAAQNRDTSEIVNTPQPSQPADGSENVPTADQGDGATQPDNGNSQPDDGVENGKHTAGAEDADAARREHNRAQAAARIARKRERQRRYEEKRQRIEEERSVYSNKDGQYFNPQLATVKQDQLREMDIEEARRRNEEFMDEAREIFQDEDTTRTFMKDCNTYGDWINENEPELAQYVVKPYGKLVLKGWFDKIAKKPDAADWWDSLNSFEKYKTLDRYYREFSDYIENYRNGGSEQRQNAPTQSHDVPVPGSGRNTNNMPPTNNFSLELDRAMQANGVNRLVR